jgi:hypothetical protein
MAHQCQTKSLQLLAECHCLVAKADFNPTGCKAMLTCADHLLVSTVASRSFLDYFQPTCHNHLMSLYAHTGLLRNTRFSRMGPGRKLDATPGSDPKIFCWQVQGVKLHFMLLACRRCCTTPMHVCAEHVKFASNTWPKPAFCLFNFNEQGLALLAMLDGQRVATGS